MNRLFYILILFIILTGCLFSNELNEYQIKKIKDIKSGSAEGMIGWQPRVAGGSSGPTTFAVSKDKIFIPDGINYRINVYDLNFNFIKTIIEKEPKEAHSAKVMRLDKNSNIIYLTSFSGLAKLDYNGAKVLFVKDNALPKQVKQFRNFFPFADEIFIYNDQKEIAMINNQGEIEKPEKTLEYLHSFTFNAQKLQIPEPGEIKLPDKKHQIIDNLLGEKKHIIINDGYYSTSFYDTKKYFDEIADIRNFIKAEKTKVPENKIKKKINIDIDKFGPRLIGYDKDHNGYWDGSRSLDNSSRNYAVIVFSKYGELLDAFYYSQWKRVTRDIIDKVGNLQKNVSQLEPNYDLYPTSDSLVSVTPCGDVYFLVGNKEKYTMYKVERQW